MPDYYKKDYTNLRASFCEMFYCVCEKVKLAEVSVDTLKRYLCRTYAELKDILQDADAVDQVMEASAVSAHSQIALILKKLLVSSN